MQTEASKHSATRQMSETTNGCRWQLQTTLSTAPTRSRPTTLRESRNLRGQLPPDDRPDQNPQSVLLGGICSSQKWPKQPVRAVPGIKTPEIGNSGATAANVGVDVDGHLGTSCQIPPSKCEFPLSLLDIEHTPVVATLDFGDQDHVADGGIEGVHPVNHQGH